MVETFIVRVNHEIRVVTYLFSLSLSMFRSPVKKYNVPRSRRTICKMYMYEWRGTRQSTRCSRAAPERVPEKRNEWTPQNQRFDALKIC